MSKSLKKWSAIVVALLLAVAMAATLCLAACGGDDDSDADDDDEDENEFVYSYGQWVDDVWEYTDASGAAAEYYYSVFVPTAYAENNSLSLSLVTYIPDSSLVFSSSETALYRTKWEAINGWITEENMTTNPTFILVFGSTSGFNFTDAGTSEGDQALKIMDAVIESYNIDEDRQYLTGQSMGGIADFYLNDKYPARFAATVYVGCQTGGTARSETDPDYYRIINNRVWENQKFVYICSRLDGQAPLGQDDMIAVLQEDNIAFGGGTSDDDELFNLNYKDLDTSDALVKAELAKGYSMNFFGFDSVTNNKAPDNEHMSSFQYCYSLNSIYDWLLSQKRDATDAEISRVKGSTVYTDEDKANFKIDETNAFDSDSSAVVYDASTKTYTVSGKSAAMGEALAGWFWGSSNASTHASCEYITFVVNANEGEKIDITTYNGTTVENTWVLYGTDTEANVSTTDGAFVLDLSDHTSGDWSMKLVVTYADNTTETYTIVTGTITASTAA